MRLAAYFLAGDPWWLENSVSSYYDLVDRIVVSYDSNRLSWVGSPLPGIDDCIDRVKAIDHDSKVILAPGPYARPDRHPLVSETYQRQCAVDQASEDVDWIIQLDSDEVLQNPSLFADCLSEADARAATGVEYPARWLYQRVGHSTSTYLERSSRWWRLTAAYPGPVAVRPRTILRHCRQADASLFRVDFRTHNTDPAHASDAVVHRAIDKDSGILHFSWVRSEEFMRIKADFSAHSDNYSQPRKLVRWAWCGQHPLLTVATTPLRRDGERFRWSKLPERYSRWIGE
jgi:hypothetical protein